ncbi:type II toxin-antitoxin system CcdA family antitoxin [Roseomonas sp. CCTCC AB2023176]|uniref:type II toxin-antitoxin system CcdA family antitoxin n=1 Tax=Roseomonas sp. CCTCC AB2023176 TaxID=3342640 RepID=UPI0035E1FECE
MNHTPDLRAPRRATNVSLPSDLVVQARELGVNLSKACENGIREAVAEAKRDAWQRAAAPGIAAYNEHVEKHGPPLAPYRTF